MKKNILFLLIIGLIAGNLSDAYAQKKKSKKKESDPVQDDKALVKEWKKKLKELKPLDYKKLVDDIGTLRNENSELNTKVTNTESEIKQADNDIEKIKAENKNLQQEIQASLNSAKTGVQPNEKGVIFKVQIGSFRNKELAKYLGNDPAFAGDIDPDGTRKYTLSYFNEYWEANRFKQSLREMGVSDAWIVAYKNGQRVDIKEVLEGKTEEN
jgi:vacuolar-type H+-ATPase subunit I/STV1